MEEISKTAPVLVTGATGFVGSALVEKLYREGVKVRAFVRKPETLRHWEKRGIELFRGDFQDLTRLEEAAADTRIIYHLGETPSTGVKSRRHNVELVRRLIGRALHSPRQRLVFVSSLSVAGIPSITPATEDAAPERELEDPYTEYKRMAESLIRSAYMDDRLDYVIVRPALIYGPGSKHLKGLIHYIDNHGRLGVPLVGRGDNIVPLVHLDDLVALLHAVGDDPKAGAKIIHAVDDGRVSARDFLRRIAQMLGRVVTIRSVPKSILKIAAAPFDALGHLIGFPFGIGGMLELMNHDAVFSNVRMKARLGAPLIYPTVTDGLPSLIEWYKMESAKAIE